MGLRRYLLLVTILVLTTLSVVIYTIPEEGDFRAENPSWNGFSQGVQAAEITKLSIITDLAPPYTDKSLIIVPYTELPQDALSTIEDFVSGGGTLLLADDFGYGNGLLEYLGLSARFSNTALLDPVLCYQNRWLPLVVRFSPGPLTNGLTEIVLNHPTALTGIDEENTIAWSSSLSFRDDNHNDIWDPGEIYGPFPVIAQYAFGEGQIILASDPSIFINSNQQLADNARLLQNINNLTGGELLFDESFLPTNNRAISKDYLVQFRDWISTPFGTMILVTAVLSLIWFLWQPGKKDIE